MKSLHGKYLNKNQAEKLEVLFDIFSRLHERMDEEGYDTFIDGQGFTDNSDAIINAADDLFVSFGFAEKRLEDK